MGTVLNIDLDGDGAYKWLPLAKSKLAAMNARAQASALRCMLKLAGVDIEILRGNVVDTIKITTGAPYLFGYYELGLIAGGYQVADVVASPEDGISQSTTVFNSIPQIGTGGPTIELMRTPYVGDGYVLALYSDLQNHQSNPNAATSWPAITKPLALKTQYLDSDPAKTGKPTSFVNTLQYQGLGRAGSRVSLFASGWQNATTRYRFGIAGLYSDGTNLLPLVFTGNTAQQAIQQAPYTHVAGRDHTPFVACVIGKGVIQALHCVVEDTSKAQVAPYFVTSTDFGDSWVNAPADVLTPYLDSMPGPPRAAYLNAQLYGLSQYAANVYLGNGRSLLVIMNGFVDKGGPGGASRYAPMAFVGSVGGSYTRVSWPPGTWYTTVNGTPVDANYGLTYPSVSFSDKQTAQLGFGVGCVYFTVVNGGVTQIMYSRDFGATWNFAPALSGSGSVGTIVKPYLSTTQPGRILFAVPDYAGNKIRFQQTDGTFQVFKSAGGPILPQGTLTAPPDASSLNYLFNHFGGQRYTPYVHAGFPGEFDAPKGTP